MNLIIAGCGRYGAELAENVARKGHNVVVIDREAKSFNRLNSEFVGRTVQGDMRDRSVLLRAEIESSEGFAAVTSKDEINLVVARAAAEIFKVPNVVARIVDPIHSSLFSASRIQTVCSTIWSANRLEQLLVHPGLIQTAELGNGNVIIIEIQTPPKFVTKRLEELVDGLQVVTIAFTRGGVTELCPINLVLENADLISMAISRPDLLTLKQRLLEE